MIRQDVGILRESRGGGVFGGPRIGYERPLRCGEQETKNVKHADKLLAVAVFS
jgi:hypothetical protein